MNLEDASDLDIIGELRRRGWRFKEVRLPIGLHLREGEPYDRCRQLQHTVRIEPAP